jgi:16S rRNA (cytosine1402-N4)-methyltransferase
MSEAPHIPVMLREVLATLRPCDGEVYLDGTLGAGGYTRAILDAADCKVIGIDRDSSAHEMAESWRRKYDGRLHLVHGAFSQAEAHLATLGHAAIDALILDLGVSSMQLDLRERGFSFRFDGPLDMRMDRSHGETAADIVNYTEQTILADMLYAYGEEKASRRIAAAIVARRAEKPFETTADLADLVRSIVRKSPKDRIDPATRTFQALRLKVNDELGEVERLLESAADILRDGGRLIIVTFHSLEDRIVKNFLNSHARQQAAPSRYLPPVANTSVPPFALITKKALLPQSDEIAANPRARSAKLRAAVRIAA